MTMSTTYAELSWSPADVQTLRPGWSIEKCEEWLNANEKYLRDRLCELGWEVMTDLLPTKTKDDRLADIAEWLEQEDDGKPSFCEDDVSLCIYVRLKYRGPRGQIVDLTMEEAAKVRAFWEKEKSC